MYLMVSDQDHALWKVAEQIPVDPPEKLPSHTCVSRYPNSGWIEPLCQSDGQKIERLFGKSYPRIIPVLVD